MCDVSRGKPPVEKVFGTRIKRRRVSNYLYIIGLTGGIATGKSTISSMLRELGAIIIDADVLSHEVTGRGEMGLELIKRRYGAGVLNEDGSLNRRKLGKVVFNDKEALRDLNAIVHPLVLERTRDILGELESKARASGTIITVVIDAPLLFEAGAEVLTDEIWVASVDLETQIERVMKRDGYTREQAIARIQAQMPLEEKEKRADVIVNTGKDVEETKNEVVRLWRGLQQELTRNEDSR